MSDKLTLAQRLRAMPLLGALVPLAAGIACGTLVAIPLYVWVLSTVVCAVTAWLLLSRRENPGATTPNRVRSRFSTIYIAFTILFFGAALARAHIPQQIIPQGKRVWMEALITDTPIRREGRRGASASATVIRWQPDSPTASASFIPSSSGTSPVAPGPGIPSSAASISLSVASSSGIPGSPTTALTPAAPSGEWLPAGERLLLSIDTMWHFEAGERVIFRGYVNPISDTTNSYLRFSPSYPGHSSELHSSRSGVGYDRLMRARGYTGRTYISQYSHPVAAPAKAKTPGIWAKKLQSAATERLRRLDRPMRQIVCKNVITGPDAIEATNKAGPTGITASATERPSPTYNTRFSEAIAVAAAMTTGDRSGITPRLRDAYSRTGASHLLAVSGLHVGIVFMIINILLYLFPLFPRGHIVKNICAIAAIWFYATLTGLSPSAMRAAFMFTGAQIALATSQTRNATNIMCATAVVMLAVRPGLLFDISFQLSFLAAAAILAWFTPLYRLLESRFKILNALWATLLIGLVASLATMPLVSYTFGVFSPAGIVLNPLIIATAHLTVIFSLVWTAVPVQLLEPLFRWLVVAPVWLQNRVVELTGAIPGAAVEWTMPLWMVFAIYAAMTIFTLWLAGRPHKTEPFALPL